MDEDSFSTMDSCVFGIGVAFLDAFRERQGDSLKVNAGILVSECPTHIRELVREKKCHLRVVKSYYSVSVT